MSTTKASKPKRAKNSETQNPDTTTPAESQQPEVGGKPLKTATHSRAGMRIVSVAFPVKTARQLRLLSSVSGEPMASIVVSAVTRVIAKRLPDALADIAKADLGDGE